MPRIKIFHYLFPPYLLLLILALFSAGWYSTKAFRDFYLDQVSEGLEHRAEILSTSLEREIASGDYSDLDREIKLIGGRSSTRVTVVLPTGKVVADSHANPETMENHLYRPEIQAAIMNTTGRATRFSSTLNEDIDYVAITLMREGKVFAVIRTAVAMDSIEGALRKIQWRIAYGGLIVAFLAGCMALLVSQRLISPLQALAAGARRLAQGDLESRLAVPNAFEIAEVADSINHMAENLKGRLAELESQKNEVEALLGGMSEGVIAINRDRRITKVNGAAVRLAGEEARDVEGKLVHEVYRNAGFLSIVDRVFSDEGPYEEEVSFYHPEERTMLVHATVLRGLGEAAEGAIFVLSDITKLRRLEQVRRDFVANVSHELKTPVTSIKGFSETLLRGGLEDPENAKKFLGIIDKHAERLRAIIDDLLILSRLEKQDSETSLEKTEVKNRIIVNGAIEACQRKIDEKGISVAINMPPESKSLVNESLIEQALVNLIDNAVKYGREKGEIRISVHESPRETILSVADDGPGIESKHLDRVFERFYRIDAGRSRETGGTGLGLAIVKHIATVHGGYPSVKSEPGKGSEFSIHIPRS